MAPKRNRKSSQPRSESDLGTKERWRRGRIVVRPVALREGAGYATTNAAMDLYATALDEAHEREWLGEGKDGTRRYDAGLRLLHLYDRAGIHPSVVASYKPTGFDGGEEMSDAQAWNREAYNGWLRHMGMYARAVVALVIDGEIRPTDRDAVLAGLDKLADGLGL